MPQRLIPLVTDHYYHVFNRGSNKQPIFLNKRDYRHFFETLEYYSFLNPPIKLSRFNALSVSERIEILESLRKSGKHIIQFTAYVLMPNHFHLLLKQVEENGISNFLRYVQNSYTKYFNTKYERVGALLQGPFKAVLVEEDSQLLHVSRYIHLNPHTAFVVKNFNDLLSYQWSSLQEYIDGRQGFCDKNIILSQFKNSEEYLEFVNDRASYQRELDEIKHLLLE